MRRLGSEGRRIPFFAEGESAVAGMPPPIFSDRHQTKRKKRKEKEAKRKERTKEKKRFIIYIYLFLKNKRIKEYIYILVCGERVVHGLVRALQRSVDSIDV